MKTLPYLIAGTFAGLVMSAGMAQAGTPSSKVAIMQGSLVGLGAEACSTTMASTCGPDPVSETEWVPVMSSLIKVPNGKELAFDVALQAGLINFTQVGGKGGKGGSSASVGRIQVRVAVGDEYMQNVQYALPCNDGVTLEIGDDAIDFGITNPGGTACMSEGGDGPNGVTYASSWQQLDLTYDNLLCGTVTEGLVTQEDCDIAIGLLLGSLNAHAFNFVLPNVTAGVKRIEVQAKAYADAKVFALSGDLSEASAEAFVGMGSTRVTTVRAVKSFDKDSPAYFEPPELD